MGKSHGTLYSTMEYNNIQNVTYQTVLQRNKPIINLPQTWYKLEINHKRKTEKINCED